MNIYLIEDSGEFTEQIKPSDTIDFQRFTVEIAGIKYVAKMKYVIIHPPSFNDIILKNSQVLQRLIQEIERSPINKSDIQKVLWDPYPADFPEKPSVLTQDFLWPVSEIDPRE